MNILLHIGAHKTGSTLLQKKFADGQEELNGKGVVFVSNVWSKIAHKIMDPKDMAYEMIDRGLKHIEDAEKSGAKTVIISSEWLFGSAARLYDDTDKLADAMFNLLCGMCVKVVAFVRRQDTFLESWYIQSLRNGITLTFDKYLEEMEKYSLDWLRCVNSYSKVFGEENISVLPYEYLFISPDKYFAGITDKLDIDFKITGPFPVLNRGLNAEGINYLLKKNIDGVHHSVSNPPAQRRFGKKPKNPHDLMTERGRLDTIARYDKSNRELFLKYGNGVPEGIYSGRKDNLLSSKF